MRRTRRPPSRLLVPLATAVALVAATPLSADPQSDEPSDVEPPCVEPHPCDYVWEGTDLGPFELGHVEEVWVDSEDDDGTMLHGWLAFPDVPDGVRAPVALHSSPYLGFCHPLAGECVPSPGNPAFWEDEPSPGVRRAWGAPPIELVRRGYVAAFFDVRGTGGSEGCMEWGGEKETRDQKVLVDWLVSQPWSNGRVGMGGNSYPGTTPWQAAIQAPEGLKTIVTAGIVTDGYTWSHTPQGMQQAIYPGTQVLLEALTSWLPHAGKGVDAVSDLGRIAGRAADTDCEPFEVAQEEGEGAFLRDRDPDFWEPRRYQDRLNQVQASVLMPHGLQDVTGHQFQDMLVWEALQGTGGTPPVSGRRPPGLPCPPLAPFCTDTPKSPPMWQISGQWSHGPPFSESPSLPVDDDWSQVLFDWLGYWLQGVGEAPPHRVDYQDTSGAWHTSSAWPPAEARLEALYVGSDRLTAAPGEGDRRFLAATSPLGLRDHFSHVAGAGSPACRQEPVPDGASETHVAYVSDPLASDSLLAGNPFAYLELSSDQPGGLVEVALLKWPVDVSCLDVDIAEAVARGAVDLRHHAGNYRGTPFPVDTPTPVRVDLFNTAVPFAAGDRLILVVSGPDTNFNHHSFGVAPHAPEVTVHAGVSHVVVPFVSGGLGGQPSGMEYPPNPAAPGVPREQ